MTNPRIILINPFVHDFAHYNLWSAPLGLYRVLEFLSQYKANLHLIDCLDSHIKAKPDGRSHVSKTKILKPTLYRSLPRRYYHFGISKEALEAKIRELLPIDAFLVTSGMTYWYPGVRATIDILKKISPKTPVILGGIYATLQEAHARRVTGADDVVTGPVDLRLIETLAQHNVNLEPNTTAGHWSQYTGASAFAPIATSSGCPMHCTYCATPILNPSFRQRSTAEVCDELSLLYDKGVRHIAFYDDALLWRAEKHMILILKHILEHLPEARFYTPVGLQARLITSEIAQLMKLAGFAHIRIGYETASSERQSETGGKVRNEELATAIKHLKTAGFDGHSIGVFIMYGLPRQPLEDVENAIAFVKSLGVNISLSEFSPIAGTQAANELPQDILDEPLLTNNTAYSYLYSNYDAAMLEDLRLDVKRHNEASPPSFARST